MESLQERVLLEKSAINQLIKVIFMTLFFVVTALNAQDWQHIAEFKQGKQELELEFRPNDQKIRLIADKGGFFSKTHKKEFSVQTRDSLQQTLDEIQSFLTEQHFSDELLPLVHSRLLQFQFLTVADCQSIHMPLNGALSESSVTDLLQEIQKMDEVLRAPANSVQSFKITEIDFNDETLNLHLSLDSRGRPTGVGLVRSEGDFRKLQMTSQEGTYSLYDDQKKWVLDIVLVSELEESNADKGKIEIEIRRPQDKLALTDVKRELIFLSPDAGEWSSSRGREGVDLETYKSESKQLLREHDALELSIENTQRFSDWLTQCKVYEAQVQLSSLDYDYFCRRLATVQASYYKGLNQVKGEIAKKSYRDRFRRCLKHHNLIKGDSSLRFNLNLMSDQKTLEVATSCQDEAYLPYARAALVSSYLSEDLMLELVHTDDLKLMFSEDLHQQAFEYCEDQKLMLSNRSCQEKIKSVKQNFLIKLKLSNLFSMRPELSVEEKESKESELNQLWESCRAERHATECSKNVFTVYADQLSYETSFDLDEILSEFRISVSQYSNWRESFKEGFNRCLNSKIQSTTDFNELISYFDFSVEDCREKASLEIFPLAYEQHLSQVSFSRYKQSRPDIWKKLIKRSSKELAEKISRHDFSHKKQLDDQLPKIISHDTVQIFSAYLEELIKQDEMTENQVERLKLLYLQSPEKGERGWSSALTSLLDKRNGVQKEVLINDFYLNIEKSALYSLIEKSTTDDRGRGQLEDIVKNCMEVSPNHTDQEWDQLALNCRKKLLAQEMFLKEKRDLEQIISEHFSLTGSEANKLMSPVWYMKRCKDEIKVSESSQEDYLARVQTCLDLAKMDTYELLMFELIKKNESLMTSQNKEAPTLSSRFCLQNIFLKMSGESGESRLKELVSAHGEATRGRGSSIYELQRQRLQSRYRRPLLSRLFPGEHLAHADADQDAQLLQNYIKAMQDHPELRGNWMTKQLNSCLEKTQESIYTALRESFIQHSEHFRAREENAQGETDVQVIRYILDDELIELILEMKDQRAGSSTSYGIDELSPGVTSEFTFDALSRAQQVISKKLAKGFIFDRDKLKTELIIFRDQLKQGLRWMNQSSQDVSINELAKFFEASQLADVLAYAEISSMVFDRFSDFLKEMKDSEMQNFQHQIGHRPLWRLSKEEKQIRSEILERYRKLEKLAHEMTSSYDFRRIIHQNDSKGRELLNILKRHFLLAQVTGREVSPEAFDKIWELMGELIIEDKTPGGFAERFVGEMAQSHLNQQKESKWAVTKALFYDDDDFDWDQLRKTSSGRRALNYYTRYLLWPRVMGRELSRYSKKLRRSEFERYLSEAQDEN